MFNIQEQLAVKEVSQLGLKPGEPIEREPHFSKRITTSADIAALGVSSENFITESEEFENAPFDTILISSSDAVDLAIRLDRYSGNIIPVKAGAIIAASNLKFRNFSIENLSATTVHTAGTVIIQVINTKFKRRA